MRASDAVALEHAVSVDHAAVSEGNLDALERAQALLAGMVDDPWRRALGEERLRRAHRLVADGALVGVRRRVEPPVARVRRAGAAVALIVFVALGTFSQSRWWLVPTAAAHALVALEFVALYERRWARPERLASRSVRDPVAGLFVMPEEAVARSLVTLANGDRVVTRRARCLLGAKGVHAHARRRLDEAERLLAESGGNRPGPRLGAWLVATAAPAVANGTLWGTHDRSSSTPRRNRLLSTLQPHHEEASVNAVLTPPRPRSAQLASVAVVLIGFAVAIAVAFAVARLAAGEPGTFTRLTVQNPTPYLVNVDVTGAERDGWLDVGSFRRERTRTVEELADQGRQWVFRFSYGGVEAGELAVSRDQLAREGWRISVPPSVGEHLRQAGLSESAH